MSPVVLHEYAWTHFPPWQLVEQHSLPPPQVFPSVVQVALLAGTGSAAHWPLAQSPEQHCDAPLQLSPMERHAPLAQVPVPPSQVRLQHSAPPVQGAFAALQNCDELHLPVAVSQAVEQQSAFFEQLSPPGVQAGGTGVVQEPPSHLPEQQALAAEHWVSPDRHWSAGSTHRFDAHEFVQQSELSPQTWPTALHCDGSTQVPLQASEQHSEGRVQVASSALQDTAGVPHVPSQPPEQHSDAAEQAIPSDLQAGGDGSPPHLQAVPSASDKARAARTVRDGARMVAPESIDERARAGLPAVHSFHSAHIRPCALLPHRCMSLAPQTHTCAPWGARVGRVGGLRYPGPHLEEDHQR